MPVLRMPFRSTSRSLSRRSLSVAVGLALLVGSAWPGGVVGSDLSKGGDSGPDQPTIQYLDAMAHAADKTTFVAGDTVTIPYTPRLGDTTVIDGKAPIALPAGSVSGKTMAATAQGSMWAPGTPAPMTPATSALSRSLQVNPSGLTNVLRREIYGFLPYWELGTDINYDTVSTIAYFGIALNTDGTLSQTGSGWSGWTSQTLTDTINAAHANHDRVALTIEAFAWGDQTAQTALLSSDTARATAAAQIAAAVHDRGIDGVNLDFEPIAAGMSNNYITFVRQLRVALDALQPGYELTWCGTGRPSTYDISGLLAAGAADNAFIMGYDFRDGASSYAASMDPLTSPRVYDLSDSVKIYTANAPASKIILGLPYYGIAYSTVDSSVYSPNHSGSTYGAAAMGVTYYTAEELKSSYPDTFVKQYDPIENSAWVSYYCVPGVCPAAGSQASWREIYYDDAQALAARCDRVNYWGLGGVGIWVLGYDRGHPELSQVLASKFLTDLNPPKAGIVDLAPIQSNETFNVSWTGRDDWNGVKNYDVQVATDGGGWADWITGTTATSALFAGTSYHNYSFRVRATDGVGNVGPWDVNTTFVGSPQFAINGFATVQAASVSLRSLPAASAATLSTSPTGTVFQIIGGPVSADGFTWYQVNGPITELNPVTPPFPGPWIAASNGTTTYMAPSTPPNTTWVGAGISTFTVGTPGMPPSLTGVDAGRTFSPDGDGIRDRLPLTWTDAYAFTNATLSIYRVDGSLAGAIALGALGWGPQSYSWNGTSDGSTALPDGQYLLQVSATTGSATYYAPSPGPLDASALAQVGVIIDTTPSGTYYPVAPVRILDTRNGTGLAGAFVAGTTRSFAVGGQHGVPANAIAVTGNLTVTRGTAKGYVLLGPNTTATASTINFNAGDDRANGVTVALAADGTLSALYIASGGGSVHLIFDLTGYFVRDANGATFIPIVPTRIVDTRIKQGIGTSLPHGAVATFNVAGLAGVPANATAIAGNATITGQNAGGYITIAPAIGGGQPTSSTLNFPSTDVRANNLVVPLNNGQLQVEYWGAVGNATQFVFDVTGYFVPGLSGATFVPLPPGRVVDSRINQGFTGPLRMTASAGFAVRGQVSVPLAAVAVVGNLTVTGQSLNGWLNAAPASTSATSTLNFPVADDRANGFVSMLGPGGTLTVTYGGPGNSATTNVVVDIVGYYR
jgi:spore germination protein YaaH